MGKHSSAHVHLAMQMAVCWRLMPLGWLVGVCNAYFNAEVHQFGTRCEPATAGDRQLPFITKMATFVNTVYLSMYWQPPAVPHLALHLHIGPHGADWNATT